MFRYILSLCSLLSFCCESPWNFIKCFFIIYWGYHVFYIFYCANMYHHNLDFQMLNNIALIEYGNLNVILYSVQAFCWEFCICLNFGCWILFLFACLFLCNFLILVSG
jgi:hypothetical protein